MMTFEPNFEQSIYNLEEKVKYLETKIIKIISQQEQELIFRERITIGRKVFLWLLGAIGAVVIFILTVLEKIDHARMGQ